MALGAWSGALFVEFSFDLFYHFSTVVAGALLVTIWFSKRLVHDKPDPSIKHEGPLFRMPNGALVRIGIIAFCCMLAEGSMADWSVNYMENVVHTSKTLAPIALSTFATAMTLGRIFGDKARAMFGDWKLIIAGGLVSTSGLCAALVFPEAGIVIAGSFFVGLGLSVIVPITYSIAGGTKDLPSGVGLAMVTTVGYTGFLLGPPVIGFIADWQNLRIALVVVAFLLFVMTLLGIFHNRKV